MGRNKFELAAKMAQDASKSGFSEALEASWGRLERPKRKLSWSKIEAWRQFFKSKRRSYTKWSWNAFLLVLEAPERSENLHFAMEWLQKSAFQDVAFQHRPETSLGEILEAKLGLSWSHVGLYIRVQSGM